MTFQWTEYTEKDRELLPRLFAILHENMNAIAPTGNGYEEDEALWCTCIEEALSKDPRKLLMIYDGETLAGFFMYYVNGDLWMMEEIQFAPAYRGSGLFRRLFAHLLSPFPVFSLSYRIFSETASPTGGYKFCWKIDGRECFCYNTKLKKYASYWRILL